MRNVVFLISLVVHILPNTEAHCHSFHLLSKLTQKLHSVKNLIHDLHDHFYDQPHSRLPLPMTRSYEITLRRASTSIDSALELMQAIEENNRSVKDEIYDDDGAEHRSSMSMRYMNTGPTTRRSDQLNWKTNFYKALSRALKDEFKDEPVIQENINDGFVPPTWLKKNNRQ